MNEDPKVSVIAACYNVERELPFCLQSIVGQSYKNIEIILVDDGSTDNTGRICDQFASQDSRIVVIHQTNSGLSAARNIGLTQASADFVTFVDADDALSTHHVKLLLDAFRSNTDADISVSSFVCVFDLEHLPDTISEGFSVRSYSSLEAIQDMFYQRNFDTSAWGKLYRKSLFDGIEYPVGLLFEDLPTTYRLMLKARKVVFVPVCSYFYLIRSCSIEGSSFSDSKFQSIMWIIKQVQGDPLLDPIRNAADCRLFCSAVRLALSIPDACPQRDELWHVILQLRQKVLNNSSARFKARVAALLSFGGIRLVRFFYSMVKVR